MYAETAITALLAALRFGIAYALFFYLAHFTALQSFSLAIVALLAFDGHRFCVRLAEKQPPQFEPFWVSVEPDWYALSIDFGLADAEKWPELQKKWAGVSGDYSILRDGVTFTVLSPTLLYSNNHQSFIGELDIREVVTELTPPVAERHVLSPFAPRFYVRRSLAGPKKNIPAIEFGLVTQESLKRSHHPADHEADMAIAWLPEIVFYDYYHSGDYGFERARKVEAKTKAVLTEFGWAQEEQAPEDSWSHQPREIAHKYLRVFYRGIS